MDTKEPMNMAHLLIKNKFRLALALVVLVLVSGSAYAMWQSPQPGIQATGTPSPYQTTPVTRGELSIVASGNGNLIPGGNTDLNFSVPGTVADIKVNVGDRVTKGETLAILQGIDALRVDVENKSLALQVAQQTLDDYLSGKDQNLAQAFSDRAAAEKALHTAQFNLHYKGEGRCDRYLTAQYEFDYENAEYHIKVWEKIQQKRNQYGNGFIEAQKKALKVESTKNFNNWKWCESFTDQEILDSQAALQIAQANYNLAAQTYKKLTVADGLDLRTVQIDEAAVENAKAQLLVSQKNLDGVTIIAPVDGVVTAVNGNIGDTLNFSRNGSTSESVSPASSLSTSTSITASLGTTSQITAFISIADLDHPKFQVYMDDTDAPNFNVGCPAAVSIASVPGKVFEGTVTIETPALVSVSGVNMVQGVVELKNTPPVPGKTLPIGESISVDVTCFQASNVLLVPVEALHNVTGSQPFVFVLQNGKPVKRDVVTGLETTAFAEIRSGLSQGEPVITSPVNP
jgi:HlyD family secretion protein